MSLIYFESAGLGPRSHLEVMYWKTVLSKNGQGKTLTLNFALLPINFLSPKGISVVSTVRSPQDWLTKFCIYYFHSSPPAFHCTLNLCIMSAKLQMIVRSLITYPCWGVMAAKTLMCGPLDIGSLKQKALRSWDVCHKGEISHVELWDGLAVQWGR